MANITGTSSAEVKFVAAIAGEVSLDELRDLVDYLENVLLLPPTTKLKTVLRQGVLNLTAEVPVEPVPPYVDPDV